MNGVVVQGRSAANERVLTEPALELVVDLVRAFRPRVEALLARRRERQLRLDRGEVLDFLPDTAALRQGDWRVAPPKADLQDRRVEITGPVDRKMVINALNAGAQVFMADFEDSTSPTWDNLITGQANLMDAVRRTITFESPGKSYKLNEKVATLMVRPRGWHLPEKHLRVDGAAIPGALLDFGLFFAHNARELVARGSGPYFYLPKMESHLEAQLWNEVFERAQQKLGLPRGTVRATVLIETLPAAFEMHEILHALKDHSAGLNCGRWDYIFSFIKKRAQDPAALLPDRAQVTMDKGFLSAYTELLIQTCHRRGAHAMGGMAAQIPIKDDPAANAAAMDKVRSDKLREVKNGHDGTWVAHPALVAVAKEVFDAHMPTPNQLGKLRDDVKVGNRELLAVPAGPRTDAGLRHNIRVGVQYLEAWLRGNGCVPLYNLMEDAATAEISRAQVWQWLRHKAEVGASALDRDRLHAAIDEEMAVVRREVGEARFSKGQFEAARGLFERLCVAEQFEDFLTLPAYELITAAEG